MRTLDDITPDQLLGCNLAAVREALTDLGLDAVIAIGSRVFGGSRPDSDLDLVIVGDWAGEIRTRFRRLERRLGYSIGSIPWPVKMVRSELVDEPHASSWRFWRLTLGAGILVAGTLDFVPQEVRDELCAPLSEGQRRALSARRYEVGRNPIAPWTTHAPDDPTWIESHLGMAVEMVSVADTGHKPLGNFDDELARAWVTVGLPAKDDRVQMLTERAASPRGRVAAADDFLATVEAWLDRVHPVPSR